MEVKYTVSADDIDWSDLAGLFCRAELGNRPAHLLEATFRKSQVTVFAHHDGCLVGAARALSDHTLWSAIFDVAVDPMCQGRGIGAKLVELIIELAGTPNVMLKSNPGKERFYGNLGFKSMPTGMERNLVAVDSA